ncbi:MAG: hypothetical protein WCQ54_12000 [Clostridiaceae bacterium]
MDNDENWVRKLFYLNEYEISKRYKYLGEGISRKVFAIDDNYVIKIAKNRNGYYQNKVEQFIYTNVNDQLRKYLCPIILFTSKCIIMRRAVPLPEIIKDKSIDIKKIRSEITAWRDLNYLARKYYLYYSDVVKISSWGKLEDNYVLIDYGCTSKEGDFYYGMYFLFSDFLKVFK